MFASVSHPVSYPWAARSKVATFTFITLEIGPFHRDTVGFLQCQQFVAVSLPRRRCVDGSSSAGALFFVFPKQSELSSRQRT